MERMKWSRIAMIGVLGGVFLGASNDAPTCDASCTVDVPNVHWTCTCRWAAPLGLACAQRTFSVPAGVKIVSPPKQVGETGTSSDGIELTGGKFEVQEGQLTFTASHDYEIRKPYSIPYHFEDQSGQTILTGMIPVTQISVKD